MEKSPGPSTEKMVLLSTRVAAATVATRVPLFVMCAAALTPPPAAMDVWRPTFDDVDRISWGRPAKRKGTGSRGTPHRLNEEERLLYDMARSKGFVEIAGSGWRRQRSDAPLCNTYRSWCDACAQPAIVLHKSSDGIDTVVLDISPLRTPEAFETAAAFSLSLETATGGWIDAEGAAPDPTEAAGAAAGAHGAGAHGAGEEARVLADAEASAEDILSGRADAFQTEPIHRLPRYHVAWQRPRPEGKALCKLLAQQWRTAQTAKKGGGGAKGMKKARGAPQVKPGASRRHGGYGIG